MTNIPKDVRESNRHAAESARIGTQSLSCLLLRHPAWSIAAILLIAFNLRPCLTSIAPLIGDIRDNFGFSGFALDILIVAPVICFGLFSPIAPPLARRFGTEAVLLASLFGIVLGCVVRSLGLVPLFVGTILIGSSMSLLGVLAPVVVKRDFPHRIGLMMGLYTMLISLGAAISTATAVPLRRALEGKWQMALLFWALPALIAAMVIIPQLFRYERARGTPIGRVRGLMRDPLAWQVTGFLALVASLAYAVFNWGPSMLEARGLDAASGGFIMSVSYVAQMGTGLTAPILASRQRDQRLIAATLVILTAVGLTALSSRPSGRSQPFRSCSALAKAVPSV